MNLKLYLLVLLPFHLFAAPANEAVMTGTNTQSIAGQKKFTGSLVVGQIVFTFQDVAGNALFSGSGSNHAVIAHTEGYQGSPFVGWSQSGAPAAYLFQDSHFDSPVVIVERSGSAEDAATVPVLLVKAGPETTGSSPVFRAGGCLALSGDNWFTVWGNGSLSLPGGLLDNTGTTQGKLAIDQVHRQLVGEDGITRILSWAGGILSGSGGGLTDLDPTHIRGYPGDSSKVLKGDGSWGTGASGGSPFIVWSAEYSSQSITVGSGIVNFTSGFYHINTQDSSYVTVASNKVYLHPGNYRVSVGAWSDSIPAGVTYKGLAGQSFAYWGFAYYTYADVAACISMAGLHQSRSAAYPALWTVGTMAANPESLRPDSPIIPAVELSGGVSGSYTMKCSLQIERIP